MNLCMPLRKVLHLALLPLLFGCDDEPEKEANKTREPREIFTYEHRFTAQWRGETREGVAIKKCKVYSSVIPTWARDLGSGTGGRVQFSCTGDNAAVAEFSDGTQFACVFAISPRLIHAIFDPIRKDNKILIRPKFDSKNKEGFSKRIWFNPSAGISDNYSIDPLFSDVIIKIGNKNLEILCFSSKIDSLKIYIQEYMLYNSNAISKHEDFVIENLSTTEIEDRLLTGDTKKFEWKNLNQIRHDEKQRKIKNVDK